MGWVRIDDDWHQHPKVLAAGLKGRALWLSAACWVSANNTGGVVPTAALPMLVGAADADPVNAATEALVLSGLWHGAGATCGDSTCPANPGPVPAGQWVFHAWWTHQVRRERLTAEERRTVRQRRRWVWRHLRPVVLTRDGHRCVRCGATEDLEADHIVAMANGGTDDLANLQALCAPCNSAKGAS